MMNSEQPSWDDLIDGEFHFRDDRDLHHMQKISLVRHFDVNGTMYAAHTPLETGPVHCTFCETPGNRVMLTVTDHE